MLYMHIFVLFIRYKYMILIDHFGIGSHRRTNNRILIINNK